MILYERIYSGHYHRIGFIWHHVHWPVAAAEAGKTQIADRFHWIHNAQQAVDEALATILPATIVLRSGDGWVPADPSGRQLPGRPVLTVPDEQIDSSRSTDA